MTQSLPPDISTVARQQGVGTPIQRYDQSNIALITCVLGGIFLLSDVLYLLSVLNNPAKFNLGQVIFWQVLELAFLVYAIYTIIRQLATYYYLCSGGFLELKRGKALKVKRALRWNDVRDTRKRGRAVYFVTDKQGVEFRIHSREVWERCNQHKGKKTKKRA